MRSCTFLKGGHELLAVMGIPYGILVVEDYGMAAVYCMEDGKVALRKAVEKKVLTTDQTGIVETAMTEAGLAVDAGAFFQKIRDFTTLPAKDHKPAHNFKLCEGCNHDLLPHGYIIAEDGSTGMKLITVWDGLEFCDNQVEKGKMSATDCAAILNAALEANLPLNADDVHRRYDALPEDTRRKYDRTFALATGFGDVPGMGRILAMGIPIPEGFFKELKKLMK